MPRYQAPRSDENRLSTLETAATTAPGDIAAGRPSITQATLDSINTFTPVFRPLYEALATTLSGRMKEVREREESRADLEPYVRDFWEVLRRRAHRLKQPAEVLVHYGLTSGGASPELNTFADLLAAADAIVAGEAAAVAAGYPAMANPSAAEVAAILAEARAQADDVPEADRAYDDAQAAIAAKRAEADLIISDIMADLRSSLRRLDEPSQRRIMRLYGAKFETLPGETPDPDPDPNPGGSSSSSSGSSSSSNGGGSSSSTGSESSSSSGTPGSSSSGSSGSSA